MDRTTRRAFRTDLVRGVAPVAILAITGAGIATLFNDSERWAGRWGPLMEYARVIMIVLVPLAVAAAAWQAGRDRRRRTDELLGTTPRPSWQHVALGWAGVTLAAVLGLVLAWLAGVALVAPIATYSGRGWWWGLAVGALALAAASALGTAVGRLVPGRLVAPLAGIGAYVLLGIGTYSDRLTWLTPSFSGATDGTRYLPGWVHVSQALWLAGLAAALVLLAAARHRWLAAIPALVAVTAAVPLVATDDEGRWRVDHTAMAPVCTDEGGLEVCLARVNAFLLDAAEEPVREQLARWDGVDGGFVRAVDRVSIDDAALAPERTAVLEVAHLMSWNGEWSEESEHGERIETVFAQAAADLVYRNCRPYAGDVTAEPAHTSMIWAAEAAHYWTIGETTPLGVVVEDGETAPFQVLLSRPEAEQKDWLGRYLAAAHTCEPAAFDALMEELR
ncbi:hypothetical protein G1H11_15630 [Phytoactinopolyspora alkaliphila]|uniref:Uncharacterized protein n=1 Tax=Phytoactinopolyspora alkaliphila TaxID=1783498 RepID=A0A6N9YP87_9ACTN|nr:hypothetical protein [Phytoactinopolyspora alkaliphila]NED96740.1 hypothetical protein [Phytoactinopolyspora alkaliphila]